MVETFVLKTELNACFSFDKIELEILIDESASAQINIESMHRSPINISRPRSEVIDFISSIITAALQAEHLSGSRSTTRYDCHLKWHDLMLPALPAFGELKATANEMYPRDVSVRKRVSCARNNHL